MYVALFLLVIMLRTLNIIFTLSTCSHSEFPPKTIRPSDHCAKLRSVYAVVK